MAFVFFSHSKFCLVTVILGIWVYSLFFDINNIKINLTIRHQCLHHFGFFQNRQKREKKIKSTELSYLMISAFLVETYSRSRKTVFGRHREYLRHFKLNNFFVQGSFFLFYLNVYEYVSNIAFT
jgi:hypothetical protein